MTDIKTFYQPGEAPPPKGTPAGDTPEAVHIEPTAAAIDFITTIRVQSGDTRAFIEIDAGRAWLTRLINQKAMVEDRLVALDLDGTSKPAKDALYPVTREDPLRHEFRSGDIPIVARPMSNNRAEKTITRAVEGAGFCIYLGSAVSGYYDLWFVSNTPDLTLNMHFVKQLEHRAGANKECLWIVGDRNRPEYWAAVKLAEALPMPPPEEEPEPAR